MMRVFISTFCIVLLLGVLLLIVPANAQRDEATVAANWTFNDGSAKDTSKKGVNGNFAGNPKAVDGIAGKALKFNGKSDGIKLPDSIDINTGDLIQIERLQRYLTVTMSALKTGSR